MFTKKISSKYSWRRFHWLWSLGLVLSVVSMGTWSGVAAAEVNYLPGLIRLECKDSYHVGEKVEVKLFVTNPSAQPVTYGMTYNVKIFDSANSLILEKDFVIYGKVTVAPGSEAALPDFVWDQKNKAGRQVDSGQYKIAIQLWEGGVAGEKTINIGEGLNNAGEEQRPVQSGNVPTTTGGSNTPQSDNLTGRIRLECQDSYYLGEKVEVTLFVVNPSAETVTYGMTYNVRIYDIAGNPIWTKDFVIYGKVAVAPGSEASLPGFVWDQRDKDGRQVNSGDYRVVVSLWQDNVAGEKTITIRPEAADNGPLYNFLKRFKIFDWFLEHWR